MRKYSLLIVGLGMGTVPVAAMAKALQCNQAQSFCVMDDRSDLTIGDKVGIFNSDGDLVATAEVSRMRDNKRSLDITGHTGRIERDDRVALLDTSAIDGAPPKALVPYREPSPVEVGGSLGYSTINLGSPEPGLEASGYVQLRKWGQWQLVGRGVYETVSAKSSSNDLNTVNQHLSFHGIGLLGGLGYEFFTTQPFSLRFEVGVGAMDTIATIGGAKGPVDNGSAGVHLKNGVGGYGRWSVGGVYNPGGPWHAHFDLAESLVDQAFANTLAIGLSHDLE